MYEFDADFHPNEAILLFSFFPVVLLGLQADDCLVTVNDDCLVIPIDDSYTLLLFHLDDG